VIFVSGSLFQAMGNTWPSLISSLARLLLLSVPAYLLSGIQGFQLRWVWWLSVAAVATQMAMNLWFLRREMRRKLDPIAAPALMVSAGG